MPRSSKGLSKRNRDHLSTALDNLPAGINYLRDPILDIARQDQELLGSGEADTNLLAKALRQNSRGSLEEEAATAADLLQGWAEERQLDKSPWASPLWFVYGFLRGGELFGTDEEEPTATAPPPPLGLQRIDLDVPEGMKAKLHGAGLELRNREVIIFVIELEERDYDIRWVQSKSHPTVTMPPEFPQPPFRAERDIPFQIGAITGEKFISRHVDSGLPVHCATLLIFPDVKVEVSITSRKPLGFDLSKYEGLLATIRRKQPE